MQVSERFYSKVNESVMPVYTSCEYLINYIIYPASVFLCNKALCCAASAVQSPKEQPQQRNSSITNRSHKSSKMLRRML